jgi:hypothetical protein
VHLFDQVLDSDMPPELAAIGIMVRPSPMANGGQ